MTGNAASVPRSSGDDGGRGRANAALLRSAQSGRLDLVKKALNEGADVGATDALDGVTALHIAVGTNNLPLVRYLVETCKAPFGPDGFGRWPTSIAVECEVSDELSDYIVEKEAEALGLTE